MTTIVNTEHNINNRPMFHSILAAMMILLLAAFAAAQESATDSTTPLGIAPGAPAGSYALSDFDNVNLFSGNLNFSMALLKIGGHGGAQTSINLTIDSVHWRVITGESDPGVKYHYAEPNEWDGKRPGYGPGVLQGRTTGRKPLQVNVYSTLTRLTFTAPDGTEYELRDELTDGQPTANRPAGSEFNRGKVFFSADGTAMTFISNADIKEYAGDGAQVFFPSGTLLMADGSQYKINSGLVDSIRDRNGNKISFEYYTDPYGYKTDKVIKFTGSLNRQVNITYANMTSIMYDEIKFLGFGGTQRSIKVWRGPLGNHLRAGYTIKSYNQLFHQLAQINASSYNPTVVTAVELPDGRQYTLRYNEYGELARVNLPTGGAINYNYTTGTGVIQDGDAFAIMRRVVSREVYANGTTLEAKMVYEMPVDVAAANVVVTVESRDGATDALMAKDTHKFYGNPAASLFDWRQKFYPAWKEGKEYETEAFDTNGAPSLRRVSQLWEQGDTNKVSWWTGMAGDAPGYNVRVAETTTTLVDTNQVTKQRYYYDQFNNKTAVDQFDYGVGAAPAAAKRRTETDYVVTGETNSINYTGYNTAPAIVENSVHLRRLPKETRLYDVNQTTGLKIDPPVAKTDFYYDETGLMARAGITGYQAPATDARGNLTSVATWLNSPGAWITTRQEYDIAGNLIKTLDARTPAGVTTFIYSDRFGSPDGEARSNTSPTEVDGQSTYAFATSVTNAAGHTSYTQFDYYTGKPVNGEDANGIITSGRYDDVLDRPTQLDVAVGTALQRRTRFIYNDLLRIIRTEGDQTAYGDGLMVGEAYYDGLGRTTESRTYESASGYILTKQSYDGLGRANRVTNPYRPGSESEYWTTTSYDGLGRARTVTTPDGAVVRTDYSGNRVLVTDQAGKQRISQTNGLGQLTDVWEIKSSDTSTVAVTFPNHAEVAFGYKTSYAYDILDNLAKVTQGSQTRYFKYDSLSRLIRARNPEQGTNSALALTDAVTGNGQWSLGYEYDENGNLKKKTDARNVVTNYVYDALNRTTSRTYSNSTPAVTYTYDGASVTYSKGRLTQVSTSATGFSSSTSYDAFDQLGRVKSSLQMTDGRAYLFNYGYNLAGQLTTETYPSGRAVTTSYDRAGRVTAVNGQKSGEASKTYASQFAYASHGAVKQMRLGNTLWETASFNPRLQPTQIALGTSPNDTSKLKLVYDYGTSANNGNVLSQQITAGATTISQSYSYDALNRLATASESGS